MESLQKPLILFIEDNPSFLKIVRLKLESSGYRVISAENGLTGFNLAKAKKPDLIICDLLLPQMDGHKICRFLKYDKNYRNIPFIVLTSRDMHKDRDLAKHCGADEFLVKTVSHDILIKTIEKLI